MSQFAKGERVRVLRDNGRDGIVGFLGTVDQITQSGVVVVLDADPAMKFRMYTPNGFPRYRPGVVIRRFFLLNDLEKLPRDPQ